MNVTFFSPQVGGHLTIEFGSLFYPKKGHENAELPGSRLFTHQITEITEIRSPTLRHMFRSVLAQTDPTPGFFQLAHVITLGFDTEFCK